jgi:histidinol-phosphate/aromatic aminotransferase/cobyric acid decarboxylase-like protein
VNAIQLVRPDVLDIPPVAHGSVASQELAHFGLTPADVLDFSVNTNPLGPAPSVLRAVRNTDWTRYPGDDEAPLRDGLAQQNGVTSDQVALGNGSAELMWLIALATLSPGDHVTVVGPTFGEDRLLVLDEAYAVFVEHRWPSALLLDRFSNIAILRSLTKDYAVPGLRLGYLLAAARLIRGIEAVRPPWSVNAGALRAGPATLEREADAHITRARTVVTESRNLLTEGLADLGYRVSPAAANFVLAHVGNGAVFRHALLPHGIVVRDCASFGLPEYVRIACRLPEHCRRLLDTVQRLEQTNVT